MWSRDPLKLARPPKAQARARSIVGRQEWKPGRDGNLDQERKGEAPQKRKQFHRQTLDSHHEKA